MNSLRASPATKAKNSLAIVGQDEKYCRVIIDIIPCVAVTSLETDAFMTDVAHVDKLMVREPQREVEKKVLKDQLRS